MSVASSVVPPAAPAPLAVDRLVSVDLDKARLLCLRFVQPCEHHQDGRSCRDLPAPSRWVVSSAAIGRATACGGWNALERDRSKNLARLSVDTIDLWRPRR